MPRLDLTTGIVFLKSGAAMLFGDGTAAAPSLALASVPAAGFFNGSGNLTLSVGGVARLQFLTGGIQMKSDFGLQWSSGTVNLASDTGLTRSAAATVAVGNGTQSDTSGTIIATNGNFGTVRVTGGASQISSVAGWYSLVDSAAAVGSRLKVDALPTIASGFGTNAAIVAGSTPFAGSIDVGTGGVATTGVINFNGTAFPAAPYVAIGWKLTNAVTRVSAISTTQLTLTSTTAWTANDFISWIAVSSK